MKWVRIGVVIAVVVGVGAALWFLAQIVASLTLMM